jgi:hypothetical protein
MKLYTIARETEVNYGHGGSGTVFRICKEGTYEIGDFPPAFLQEKDAQDYIDTMPHLRTWKEKVVELEVIE